MPILNRFFRPQPLLRRRLAPVASATLLIGTALAGGARAEAGPVCARTIKADVVAIEQAYLLNRFSAFVPAGMLFALKRDVVALDPDQGPVGPGNAMLRPDKRPRPIVLRVNEGDCLEVTFTNYLSPVARLEGGIPAQNHGNLPGHVQAMPGSPPSTAIRPAEPVSVDAPRTRAASFHITGMSVVPISEAECPANVACGGDGSNVGLNRGVVFRTDSGDALKAAYSHGSLALPGQTVVTKWLAEKDGAYFAYSMGAPIGGEGDGGQIGLGLFGAVNVEPRGSEWYRSQVRHDELVADTATRAGDRHPYAHVDYEKLKLLTPDPLDTTGKVFDIAHTDLNAIIVPPPAAPGDCKPEGRADGSVCAQAFREFTVIFHDEVHAEQAFPQLADESDPLSLIKDGMGINYGVSSMGSALMATPKFDKLPPTKDCVECRAEEFFLSSWANGDPALLLRYEDGKAAGALYPDDPSNVHHSYMGDNVRFRNLHAGPKETHVFHLHAHQWVPDRSDPNASYLDSQTISPGATFSYDIEFGGSGNRAYTPGDSIFHCHLYPHFAQGMWELWRSHDTFNDGKVGWFDKTKPVSETNSPFNMNLPDAEIATGTETPALVPIPGNALAPMPSAAFRGYPFYIPGVPGHRPPQPVLDFDVAADSAPVDGGLPRHVVLWSRDKEDPEGKTADKAEADKAEVVAEELKTGGETTQVIAARVASQAASAMALAGQWDELKLREVAETGEPDELMAMKFHEGALPGLDAVPDPAPPFPAWWRPKAYRTKRADFVPVQTEAASPPPAGDPLFYVNGRPPVSGAPYADPCPTEAPVRDYRAAFIQTELTYNKHGWFDPQGRIVILENDIKDIIDPDTRTSLPAPLFFRANSGECIDVKSSNFVPAALNADDFQIFTPTDTIGQVREPERSLSAQRAERPRPGRHAAAEGRLRGRHHRQHHQRRIRRRRGADSRKGRSTPLRASCRTSTSPPACSTSAPRACTAAPVSSSTTPTESMASTTTTPPARCCRRTTASPPTTRTPPSTPAPAFPSASRGSTRRWPTTRSARPQTAPPGPDPRPTASPAGRCRPSATPPAPSSRPAIRSGRCRSASVTT
ncbi:MAG: hypothetical protein QM699_02280 [Amaricoccus sp.]|uniref:hypothetical protein n=1 Tax=Amaricoccus sp. TaxID=1872485 RepID=UPI0039E3565B